MHAKRRQGSPTGLRWRRIACQPRVLGKAWWSQMEERDHKEKKGSNSILKTSEAARIDLKAGCKINVRNTDNQVQNADCE